MMERIAEASPHLKESSASPARTMRFPDARFRHLLVGLQSYRNSGPVHGELSDGFPLGFVFVGANGLDVLLIEHDAVGTDR